MSNSKLMVHFIWTTKKRQPIITKKLKPLLLSHIKTNSIEKGIYIDCMNCVEDHIHLLISLGREQTSSKVAMLIKGESSHWVNKQKICDYKFEWQKDYLSIGICENRIPIVRKYIANQAMHHEKKSYEEEFKEILKAHGLYIDSAKADL
ncbi:IS200/IS605 family transposase [soil metagenome]